MSTPEEEDVILTPLDSPDTPVEENSSVDAEEETLAAVVDPNDAPVDFGPDTVMYPEDQISLKVASEEDTIDLLRQSEESGTAIEFNRRLRTVGSWENLMVRAIFEPNYEESRVEEALKALSTDDRQSMSTRLRNAENKTLLRTSSIMSDPAADGKMLTGEAAMIAFQCQEAGGGYRVPLYNSGLSIDVIVPTGNDMQTLLTNCILLDRQLGASSGAHYFAYNDLVYKNQILNFLKPLIINSSYADWRDKDKLWSVIKFPDLSAIVATLAALCYPDGFDGFVVPCTRPISEEHPHLCRHVEKLTVSIFDLIITRWSVLSEASVKHMVAARSGTVKHSLEDIVKYQAGLGVEGEEIIFDNTTFVMRVPSVAEHLDAGQKFIADVVNEIEGDNTEGQYEQFGFRYVRTFMPWIAHIETKLKSGKVIKTADDAVVKRELEKLDDRNADGSVRDKLRAYINKTQLTYVGYPATTCPTCNYTPDTPSGLMVFDPFNAFFTLAFRYLKKES